MERKSVALHIPDDAPEGTFEAVFSTFNRIDKGRDVVKRSAFDGLEGVEVPLVWSHEWQTLPIGKGTIHVESKQAVVHGRFHLATQWSRDALATVKAMGGLQEYSYGYDIAPDGATFKDGEDGLPIREITQFSRIFEISPVLVGMGEDTRTLAIKAAAELLRANEQSGEKPLPNFHACRVRQPSEFQDGSFRTMSRDHDGKQYDVIMGKLKGESTMTTQALRYPKDNWTAAQARAHCKDHDGIAFEPAGESSGLCSECLEAKAGARLSQASQGHIRAAIEALQALLGEAGAADSDAGKQADASTITVADLQAAGASAADVSARLAADLVAYLAWAEAQPDADFRAAVEWISSVMRRAGEVQAGLEQSLKRITAADPETLSALKARSLTLVRQLTPIVERSAEWHRS